ncbi:MAG TPA: HipA family kinase [Thermoanaerobaculia bacterium]|nr:HipA family kinase [Thermoanaerobaculia bacterium]
MIDLPTLHARRYVQPLREGGSLPAVVDTEGGLYVVKFRGAGQGALALVAELVAGLLARTAGLPVPDLALVEVAPLFGRSEPDPEIQDVLRGSHGTNVGLRYLDGAFNFDPLAAGDLVVPDFAADLVWLDAWLTNPDRTARNPNLLVWQGRLWPIDHGATIYAHHDWPSVDEARTRTPFARIRDHVLLGPSGDLDAADARMTARLPEEAIAEVVAAVPDALLLDRPGPFATAAEARARYVDYLTTRRAAPRAWLAEAIRAKGELAAQPPRRLSARR